MKVGLVCGYHLGSPGGVQRQVLEWSERLRRLGHESVILTCGPKVDLDRDDIVFFGNHFLVPTNDDIGVLSVYLKDGESLKNYFHKFDILIGAIIVIGIVWYIWRHINNSKFKNQNAKL